jgi:transcription antitermination factor NusG
MQWFALYTAPRHEKKVSIYLQEQQIESFLPLHRAINYWKNRTKSALELPLFPSYVFVRIANQMRGKVLGVPGVLNLVGSRREPWPLPDFEMEALRFGLEYCKPEPHPYFAAGDRVRIGGGPLAGMQGVLVKKKNGPRVVLAIDQIKRSVSVEVDVQYLQAVSAEVQAS